MLDSALSWAALNAGANYADGITSDGNGNIDWAFDGGGTYLINKRIVSTSKDRRVREQGLREHRGHRRGCNERRLQRAQEQLDAGGWTADIGLRGRAHEPGRVAAAGGYFYYVIGAQWRHLGNGSHRSRRRRDADFAHDRRSRPQSAGLHRDRRRERLLERHRRRRHLPRARCGRGAVPLVKQAGAAALTTDGTYVYFVNSTTSQFSGSPSRPRMRKKTPWRKPR